MPAVGTRNERKGNGMAEQTSPAFLVFSKEEYADRLARARKLMVQNNFDALLVSAPANLVYLTGYRTNLFDSNFRPFLSVIPADGDPVLLLPNLEVGVGQEISPFKDIRAWGTTKECVAPDAITATRDVIVEKKLDHGHIAIEQGNGMRIGLGLDQFAQLKDATPGVTWENSAPLLWELRKIKSPAEIDYIRESQRINDASYEAALKFAHEGVTEKDLLRVLGPR